MQVLHVCTEIFPLLKTGGLADVVGALPAALTRLGCDARVLVPGFPALRAGIRDQQLVAEMGAGFGASAIRLYCGALPDNDVIVYVIDAPELYNRPGNPYSDADNHAYPDNYRRFALLGWMAARMAEGLDPYWRPHILHGHDWHAGLVPAYLRVAEDHAGRKLAGSVFTIHNLAYQGNFPHHVFSDVQLPAYYYGVNGVEFHGQFSFLKAGLFYSDKITTVSPAYAHEIQGNEQGCGLNGLLTSRSHDLTGILNGVDDTVWNPATDALLPATYDSRSLAGKLVCKTTLQQDSGLTVHNEAPLFCIVSRLTEQKGLHLVLAVIPDIVQRGGQIVVLGNGDKHLEAAFRDIAAAHPHSVSVTIGYDERLSHRIIAASDVIMVPSRFEPCGLTQLYGLKYGTLPLVRKVGGLADTVVDCALENMADGLATGFVFDHFDNAGINSAVRRAFALYKRKADWKQVQKRAMQQQFGWETAAQQFINLYQEVGSTIE